MREQNPSSDLDQSLQDGRYSAPVTWSCPSQKVGLLKSPLEQVVCQLTSATNNKYFDSPYCRAEMYADRVTCCP